MDSASAQTDLEFVKQIVEKTSQRIDAHAFHSVHWGVIVLIWYPIANWFWLEGMTTWYIAIGIASVLLGTVLSVWRGAATVKNPRLAGANTFISNQLSTIVFANLIAGFVLSAIAPATDFIAGPNVPIIWGLVYANMAFMMGVTYSLDFLVSGIAIFAGCIIAVFLQPYNGFILGPFMGLGMIIPGLRAEARIRLLTSTGPAPETAG